MMNLESRRIKIAIAISLFLAFYCGRCARPAPQPEEPAPRPVVFASAADGQEHRRLLQKHGLEGEVAVLCRDVLGWYYIKNGRRYKFQ